MQRGGALFFEVRDEQENRPISCGGILLPAQGETGLIFNLCTRPDHCGQGLASQIVNRLCLEAFWQGKTPVLDCAQPHLEGYYQKLGFETQASWKRLELGIPAREQQE